MVNLGPIDFQLGLPFNINGNEGQKNVTKMANFRLKIGQDATFAPALNWHNSAIFPLIFTFKSLK